MNRRSFLRALVAGTAVALIAAAPRALSDDEWVESCVRPDSGLNLCRCSECWGPAMQKRHEALELALMVGGAGNLLLQSVISRTIREIHAKAMGGLP